MRDVETYLWCVPWLWLKSGQENEWMDGERQLGNPGKLEPSEDMEWKHYE